MRHFLKYWVPAFVWMVLICIGSTDVVSAEHTSRFIVPLLRWLDPHLSWAAIDAIHTGIRKLGHVTEYAILAMLLWRASFRRANREATLSVLFIVVWLACCVFAASDEYHQSFVPSRTASVHDVIIDITGAFIGLAICWMLAARKASRASPLGS